MAYMSDGIEVTNILHKAGTATITFNCKPFKYYKSGKKSYYFARKYQAIYKSISPNGTSFPQPGTYGGYDYYDSEKFTFFVANLIGPYSHSTGTPYFNLSVNSEYQDYINPADKSIMLYNPSTYKSYPTIILHPWNESHSVMSGNYNKILEGIITITRFNRKLIVYDGTPIDTGCCKRTTTIKFNKLNDSRGYGTILNCEYMHAKAYNLISDTNRNNVMEYTESMHTGKVNEVKDENGKVVGTTTVWTEVNKQILPDLSLYNSDWSNVITVGVDESISENGLYYVEVIPNWRRI